MPIERNPNIKCLFTDNDWLFWELHQRKKKYDNYHYPKGHKLIYGRYHCKYCNFIASIQYGSKTALAGIFKHLFENHEDQIRKNDEDVNPSYLAWLKTWDFKEYQKRYGD